MKSALESALKPARKSARRPLLSWLLGLSLSFGACAHSDTPASAPVSSSPDLSPEALARLRTQALSKVDRLSRELEKLRGLSFKRPVKVEVQTLSDFQKYVNVQLEKALPAEEARRQSATLHALGLVADGFDLRAGLSDMVVSQAGAYYDPQTETFYLLMADLPESQLESIMLHELEHALQDQHFDLRALQEKQRAEPDEDRRAAISFVIEGEATYVMLRHELARAGRDISQLEPDMQTMVFKMMRDMDRGALLSGMKRMARGRDASDALRRAMEGTLNLPAYLFWSLYDPYMKGQYGVHFAYGQGGWQAVGQLFTQPPRSTEQLLHPLPYSGPQDEPTTVAALPREKLAAQGWSEVWSNVMGEASLAAFLEQHLEKRQPALSTGWDGDRFAHYDHPDGRSMLTWELVWDSEPDAREFANAIRPLLERQKLGAGSGERGIFLEQQGSWVQILAGSKSALETFQAVLPRRE
ncbi:MAG: hypothetical protein ACKO6N_27235 [Myxococcota bacterium]